MTIYTYYLIYNNLRTKSFPFDCIYSSLPMVQHCIQTRFSVFLDRNEIIKIDECL